MSPSDAALGASAIVGPLEQQYRRSVNFRNASETERLTPTHWHIAVANGLGWMFDGMDGLIMALIAPMVIKEFGVDLPTWRTGVQISLLVGVAGMFVWPWLADRYGRRRCWHSTSPCSRCRCRCWPGPPPSSPTSRCAAASTSRSTVSGVGVTGLIASGWISDRIGRRAAFYTVLLQEAVFLTLWVFATNDLSLWVFGLLWSIGYLGFWGPAMTLTSEIFPTRIRGVANGFVWAVAWFVGFILWPFITIYLQQRTGSWQLSLPDLPGHDDRHGDRRVPVRARPRAAGTGRDRHLTCARRELRPSPWRRTSRRP